MPSLPPPPPRFDVGDPTDPEIIVPLPMEALAPAPLPLDALTALPSLPPEALPLDALTPLAAVPAPRPTPTPAPAAPPVSSAARAPTPSPFAVGPWPAAIPGKEDARRFLLGVADPGPKLRDPTQRVLATLPAEARAALAGDALAFDAGALTELALCAWRVAAALATVPVNGATWSPDAKAAMLAEADVALMGVAMADDPVRELAKHAKAALTRDAVALSEIVLATPTPAPPPVREPTRKISTPVPERDNRRPLIAAVVVLGLASAAYHLSHLFAPQEPLVPASARVVELKSPNAGGYRVVQAGPSTSPGEAEEKARALAKETGNEVTKVGARVFVVAPKGVSPLERKR